MEYQSEEYCVQDKFYQAIVNYSQKKKDLTLLSMQFLNSIKFLRYPVNLDLIFTSIACKQHFYHKFLR